MAGARLTSAARSAVRHKRMKGRQSWEAEAEHSRPDFVLMVPCGCCSGLCLCGGRCCVLAGRSVSDPSGHQGETVRTSIGAYLGPGRARGL